MIFALGYQSLSTFVTPAARAITQPTTTDPAEQRWIFGLSGVVLVDLVGTSNATWRHEQLLISPNLGSALIPALTRYSIPTPPGTPGKDWAPWLQVEDSLPIAMLGSIFDANESINAGFAVDAWTTQTRPGTEAGTGATVQGLISGLVADLAVRDNDAILHRVSFSLLAQGRMRFVTSLG
ncbi:MAG: hypothetical protein WCG47_34105 [Dermatophilaceae bacterium]